MKEADSSEEDLYQGREQTQVKHQILKQYLLPFAIKIGHGWSAINYIDAFSGPWNANSEGLKDTSFSIALEELREARKTLQNKKHLELRGFFVEKDREAYEKLRSFAAGISDVEVKTKHARFEDSIEDVSKFVADGPRKSFTFIFIDPTGWTGFAMDCISPLFNLKPCEVLINFMTKDIIRFANDPAQQAGFEQLFGEVDYLGRTAGLKGQDRERELVRCYMDALRKHGHFDYVCSSIILDPKKDRTHFHLIYATRHLEGINVFKKAEKKSMEDMETLRDKAQRRKRECNSGQGEFHFEGSPSNSSCYNNLRERYLAKSRSLVVKLINAHPQTPYDDVWAKALTWPLVWPTDVKQWVNEWEKQEVIRIDGRESNRHHVSPGKNHSLVRLVDKIT